MGSFVAAGAALRCACCNALNEQRFVLLSHKFCFHIASFGSRSRTFFAATFVIAVHLKCSVRFHFSFVSLASADSRA